MLSNQGLKEAQDVGVIDHRFVHLTESTGSMPR